MYVCVESVFAQRARFPKPGALLAGLLYEVALEGLAAQRFKTKGYSQMQEVFLLSAC